jgi:hypothetical protein
MKSNNSPPTDSVPALVERGFALYRQLSRLNDEYTRIKEHLKREAAGRPHERIPLRRANNLGEQWIARGRDCECRIVFPPPPLISSFDPNQPLFTTIQNIAGDHFHDLFRRVTMVEARRRKGFRRQIIELLEPADAQYLIEVCSGAPQTKTYWKSLVAGKVRL